MVNKVKEAVISMFKPYANFNGRTSRSDFWYAWLGIFAVEIILSILSGLVAKIGALSMLMSIITMIYSFGILIPSIAIAVRRLHDIGKAGIYYLFALIPCVGIFILIYFLAQPGMGASNEYGEVPVSVTAD